MVMQNANAIGEAQRPPSSPMGIAMVGRNIAMALVGAGMPPEKATAYAQQALSQPDPIGALRDLYNRFVSVPPPGPGPRPMPRPGPRPMPDPPMVVPPPAPEVPPATFTPETGPVGKTPSGITKPFTERPNLSESPNISIKTKPDEKPYGDDQVKGSVKPQPARPSARQRSDALKAKKIKEKAKKTQADRREPPKYVPSKVMRNVRQNRG